MNTPRVSLGLPVYNGAQFLEETLQSIVTQSFEDWELIVCDNASTDATPDICARWQQRDARIRYERGASNRGAAYNYNRALQLARGEYFKWCAHDDLLSANFLASCVAVLDRTPAAVLSYAPLVLIDEQGAVTEESALRLGMGIDSPSRRFVRMVDQMGLCTPVFGLMRTDALRRTQGIGSFPHADRVTLLEMSLLGEFHRADQARFFLRRHAGVSLRANPSARGLQRWYDTSFSGRPRHPWLGLIIEKWRCVQRAPVSGWHKLICQLRVSRFAGGTAAMLVRRRLARGH